jgi:hypothetical protein
MGWGSYIEESALDAIGTADPEYKVYPIAEFQQKEKEVYHCECKRTFWIEERGWFLSWEFVKGIKAQMWDSNQDLHKNLNAFLDGAIREEMKVVVLTLDKSTVKLYCPNDKCKVDGFISRTKVQAEKTTHFCDICQTVLTW